LTDSSTADVARRARLEYAAKAFIVMSFVGALVAGGARLAQRAALSPASRIDLSRWTVLQRPAWSTLDDVRAIRDQSGIASYWASTYDTPALLGVDRWLANPPAVRRVVVLKRVGQNALDAVLELRRPAVAVRVAGKQDLYVETDEEGVALSRPVPARPVREGFPLRVVVGASGRVPAPGGSFGEDVIAAASVAEYLDSFSDAGGRALLATVDRIDVSNYAGRSRPGASEIVLGATPRPANEAPAAGAPPAASPKCVIEWGRADESPGSGGEMPFDAKASRLLQALRLFPGLAGLRTVRVAFDDLIVVPDGPNAPAHLGRALEIDGGVQSK
jgi:hypothetical protein